MNEELYFNDELRKCLNAAGLSDCGENDAWNYWYHRVHKAHDQAVDRVTEAQRAENAKLREEIEAAKHDLQVFSMGSVQLESENAKLREQMERLRTQLADVTKSVGRVEERCAKTFEVGKRWMAKAARFEAENAKLRELCADMWHVMWACAEQRCKHRENECYVVNGNNGALPSHDECWYERRMRELGVDE